MTFNCKRKTIIQDKVQAQLLCKNLKSNTLGVWSPFFLSLMKELI